MIRFFAKSPAFTAIAILTLAIGIGANTSIFSIANALLLRPLAFRDPDRIVTLDARRQGQAGSGPLTWPRYQLISENARSFSAIAAYCGETFNLTGQGDPEQIPSARVSANYFPILGVTPALGRAFRTDEDRAGGDNVVVITDSLWERLFARGNVLGRTLTLDGKDYSVVGVLPPDFRFAFLGRADLYAPRVFELNAITPQQVASGSGFLNYVARLAPGVSLEAARVELAALAVRYRQQYPKFPDADPALIVHAGTLRDEMVSSVRVAVLVLFAAVSVVLLIACANLASLLLSRALRRKQEIAVRIAIGATHSDIVLQLLRESLTLAAIGGALGLLLSYWGTRALASLAEGTLPRAAEIGIDARVLAFTAIASLAAGVIFGLIPALQVSRPDLNSVLRSEGGRGATGGHRHHTMRTALVVAQIALSTVLLIGAGLLLRNFLQLQTTSAGFDTAHLLTMNITLPPSRYPAVPQVLAFTDELLRQVRGLPGVHSAAIASAQPLNPTRFAPSLAEGQPQVPLAERPLMNVQMVSEGYASTMRVPLKRGREFTAHDDARAPRVAMVNETLARRYWPNQDPIGKHVLLGRIATPIEVVGVLGDVRNISVASDVQPEIFVPWNQLPWANIHLVIRTTLNPAVRAAVAAVDKDQPVTKVRAMSELFEESAAQPRFTAYLLGALATAALVLAMVGIYGVIAYTVTERTQEMGIRIALGAARADILHLVLRQWLLTAGAGIAIGLAASFALTRLMSTLLYQVSVTDPFTFVIGPVAFLCIAAAASFLPANRATRVDPAITLR